MKIIIPVFALLALIAAVITYNVWRAVAEPVVATPGAYEVGRQQLQTQLEAAKKREAQFEQQDWDSIALLRQLIASHQQRIDKLAGNKEAADIVAYDRGSITRLEARIAELEAKQRAQWAQKADDTTKP
jgi:hypothetical protein